MGGPWFDECEVTQRKKNRNQMANAHIPKHGFSSQGCDARKLSASFISWR